ncbi:MAG: GAF domain-containing protein [Bryobacteraceae bacterium]|nr:GAF domain-containing protein [Bryobacteraceae bacterium]MDW8378735.1 GAF domain-containing protein [Bryobacterales bacterium]
MGLLETARELASHPDRAQKILQAAIEALGADSGTVHLLGDDGLLHLAASHQIPQAVLQLVAEIPVGKGMAGLAVERGQPVTACNIQTDTSGDVRPAAKATGMEGAIVVPVFRGSQVVGAFGVASRQQRTFTADEVALLVEVARCVA